MDTIPVPRPNAAITGDVMLYRKPELLSYELHGKLGVNPPAIAYDFAVNAHVCPITVPEFGLAAADYPIIFVGENRDPIVVFGLTEGQNLFATPETGWEIGVYMPFFIRRYPFILASPDPATKPANAEDKYLVGIDRGWECVTENAQYPFFDEKGEATEYTQNCIQLCNNFEMQVRMTQSFVQLLKDNDLLELRTTTYTPPNPDGTPGQPQTIAEYYGVTEERMKALSPQKLAELRDNGALQQIYAHMNSLLAWDRLIIRALARQANQAPTAGNA